MPTPNGNRDLNVVLHTGMHKTGTTSFQNWLRLNALALEKSAVRAFVTPPQVNAKNREAFDADWLVRQTDAAKRDGVARVLVSSEVISTFNLAQWHELLEPLQGCPVTVVTVFRHWTSFLPSRWAQNCRRRDAQSFPRFLERLLGADIQDGLQFDKVLLKPARLGIQDIRAISYDNASASNTLLKTLHDACGLGILAREPVHSARRNPSLPRPIVEKIRLFNGVRSEVERRNPDDLFDSQSEQLAVDIFFDDAARIASYLDQAPGLDRLLDALIADRARVLTLTPGDFETWSIAMERAVRPYLFNPRNDKMFPAPRRTVFRVSSLESHELPQTLRETIVREFGWGNPGHAT